MQGMLINGLGICQLHHLTQIHYGNSVGNMTNYQKIVGNKQIGQTQLLLQVVKHIDNLSLDGNVQCRNRFVTDDELRVNCQRTGNADTLPLTAGEFVGVTGGVFAVQANIAHQLQNPLLTFRSLVVHFMDIQRLTDDIRDGHTGVEGGIGILENHSGLLAEFLNIALGNDLLTVIPDFTGSRLIQMQDGTANSGFTTTGLTNKTQCFTLMDGEGNTVHSLQGLCFESTHTDIKILLQILDFQQGLLFVITHWSSPPSSSMVPSSTPFFTFIQQAAA